MKLSSILIVVSAAVAEDRFNGGGKPAIKKMSKFGQNMIDILDDSFQGQRPNFVARQKDWYQKLVDRMSLKQALCGDEEFTDEDLAAIDAELDSDEDIIAADRYDRDDPEKAVTQVSRGFTRWIYAYLTNCGQFQTRKAIAIKKQIEKHQNKIIYAYNQL